MKEKKRTFINVTEYFKKLLEKNGFTVELYGENFDPKKKGDKLLTIGFMPRILVEDVFHYGDMLPENIIVVDGDSINIFHETTKEARMPHIAVYSHKEKSYEKEPEINRFGGVISTAQEGWKFKTEKDGLKFSLHGPKPLKHAKGFELWYDFIFKMEYFVAKDIQKIIAEEMKKLKDEMLKANKKPEVKK